MQRASLRLAAHFLALTQLAGCGDDVPPPEVSRPGEVLPSTEVALDSAQRAAAGVRLGIVEDLPADTIRLTGTITFDAARESHVGPRIQGRISAVPVDIGSHVARGDTLVMLDSPELGAAQARWAQARVAREVAQRNHQRTERLFADGIASERRRLEVEAELREREATLAAARQELAAVGAEPDSTSSGRFVIRAPLDGEVVEKHATVGEVVGPEENLFVIGELDRVWLLLDLYETDLPRVQAGLPVVVVADAWPERRFAARVALVSSVVDTLSRTVKVRVEIPNPDHVLKPGMFARAALAIAAPPGRIGVPHEAIQELQGRTVVFRPSGDGRFRSVPVRAAPPQAGGWIEILEGLRRGDSVVVAGAFDLKAQLLRSTFAEED